MRKTAQWVWLGIAAMLVVMLGFNCEVLAAPGGGNGGGGGGGGGGGNGGGGGGGSGEDDLGQLYADQVVIVRDVTAEGDGKPIYFTWEWSEEFYTDGEFDPQVGDFEEPNAIISFTVTEDPGCVQPVSYQPLAYLDDSIGQFDLASTGEDGVYHYDSYGREIANTYLIPLDPECKIPESFADSWGEMVMENEAGRLNLSRSPEEVRQAAYEEVLVTLNQATSIRLDPAGRLLLELPPEDELSSSIMKTIDSPRENLALYEMVMDKGCLAQSEIDKIDLTGDAVAALDDGGLGHLVCAEESNPADVDADDLQRAASFLAGAGDKKGRITVDILVYLNNWLGLNDIDNENISYYDFKAFSYNRCAEYGATTADLLQPDELDSEGYPVSFTPVVGVTIFDKRFSYTWSEGTCTVGGETYDIYADVDIDSPIINFVRAADDALVTINYIHNYELPAYPMEPVAEE